MESAKDKQYRVDYKATQMRLSKAKAAVDRQRHASPINQLAIQRAEEKYIKLKLEFDAMEKPVKRAYTKAETDPGKVPAVKKPISVYIESIENAKKHAGQETKKISIDKDVELPISARHGRKILVTLPFAKLAVGESFTTELPYEQKNVNQMKSQFKRYLLERPEESIKEFFIGMDKNKHVRCWRLK